MISEIIAIIGLVLIITGNLTIYKSKKFRLKYTYPLLISGGIVLIIYSIIKKDLIFTILQIVFTLSSLYGLIRLHLKIKKSQKLKK